MAALGRLFSAIVIEIGATHRGGFDHLEPNVENGTEVTRTCHHAVQPARIRTANKCNLGFVVLRLISQTPIVPITMNCSVFAACCRGVVLTRTSTSRAVLFHKLSARWPWQYLPASFEALPLAQWKTKTSERHNIIIINPWRPALLPTSVSTNLRTRFACPIWPVCSIHGKILDAENSLDSLIITAKSRKRAPVGERPILWL